MNVSQSRQVLAALLVVVAQIFHAGKVVAESETRPVPCNVFNVGPTGSEITFPVKVESDGVHSLVIVPLECPNAVLNLQIDPSRAKANWWKEFRKSRVIGSSGNGRQGCDCELPRVFGAIR
jgi:hypothetical protein